MEALLLMNTASDLKHEVVDKLLDNPGIANAYPVFGAYDIVAMADVEDIATYQRVLRDQIPEIALLTTLIADEKDVDIIQVQRPWLLH